MTDWSKLYDEFLYDCYIANQLLTEEDWHYYGREEHHIEIPNRDGGVLGPLNSQYLTKYQHWVAGVLQSEVLGKCCFAFIPKGALPSLLGGLKDKWALEGCGEAGRVGGKAGDLSSRNRKVALNRWGKLSKEEKRTQTSKARNSRSLEEKVEAQLRSWGSKTPEELLEHGRKSNSQRCRCLETGHITTPGALTNWQAARSIDSSLRERVG